MGSEVDGKFPCGQGLGTGNQLGWLLQVVKTWCKWGMVVTGRAKAA